MNDRNEQLSALLDNDLQPTELAHFMDDLKRDPLAEGETLQRYQLIGKTLRGELDAAAFMDVSAAVQRAIAQESVPVISNVRSLRPRWLPATRSLVRPVAGLALAASVAMVTVLSVRMLQSDDAAPVASPALAVVNAPLANPAPVNLQVAQQLQVVANSNALPVRATEQAAPQLNNYLMRHSGAAGPATMQGVMPYARAVSFQSENGN